MWWLTFAINKCDTVWLAERDLFYSLQESTAAWLEPLNDGTVAALGPTRDTRSLSSMFGWSNAHSHNPGDLKARPYSAGSHDARARALLGYINR